MLFVDFRLAAPGSMSVSATHEICDRPERANKEGFPIR